MISFQDILSQFRKKSASEREKGTRFERLMQLYLRTETASAQSMVARGETEIPANVNKLIG